MVGIIICIHAYLFLNKINDDYGMITNTLCMHMVFFCRVYMYLIQALAHYFDISIHCSPRKHIRGGVGI